MKEHKYILEPYKGMNTRYRCPSCQQRDKTFSLYIDTETGEHIHPTVGRCNRESNCGHHYTPKQYFQDNSISFDTPQPKAYKPRPVTPLPKPVSFIPVEVFKASLKAHETNHFVQFLINLFGVEVASQLVSRYFIATSKHWNGATVFWQIDTQGKVRTGKIMLYSPTTGKRVKNLELPVYWVHKALKQPEFELRQCLFGEHLLIDKTKPVAIVESEKTAVIASGYLPQFIWVAVGSLTNLNAEKCSILKGRTVTLFPDLNGFDKWSSKAKELSHLAQFTVSDLLERKATEAERKQGFDLADYLIKYDYKAFALPEPEATEPPPAVQPLVEVKPFEQPEPVYYFNKPEQPKPENWEQDITELENYFTGIALPTQPVKLNRCSTITDCSQFIESHFATVKANNGKRTFLPYLNRLQELKQVLTTNLN
ncbi:hypothetical protein CHU92_08025 [Flavobacterium cyanobacteriorum]|uniref:Toprim domain-containing protein n=1 Tax=Flavobacterium cyanobacteriorum TaxID=2022802 RepID=A0A255Z7U8_9FLAO|nr:DUF6371 domain-containing protein [Flavobacterium cyanobacteriorum]OYQ37526.1 hypothetical protein CHU92_08025 [Flavobacterium cyanobacteriorum]